MITLRLTKLEADEIWLALDSRSQELSDNADTAMDDPRARAALSRAISKLQKEMSR